MAFVPPKNTHSAARPDFKLGRYPIVRFVRTGDTPLPPDVQNIFKHKLVVTQLLAARAGTQPAPGVEIDIVGNKPD